jgi:hypothetical protein
LKANTNLTLAAAALLFGLQIVPRIALASTAANCPVEPHSGQPIASGNVYGGTNCTINTTGDIDSFVFTANAGETWQAVAAGNGVPFNGINICLTLFDPNGKDVFSQCSNSNAFRCRGLSAADNLWPVYYEYNRAD